MSSVRPGRTRIRAWQSLGESTKQESTAGPKPSPNGCAPGKNWGARHPCTPTMQTCRSLQLPAPASNPRDHRLSRRIGAIAESATLKVDAKAKALKAEGRPVIGFGAGEPDFPTPGLHRRRRRRGLPGPEEPPLHPAGGLPELKKAIARRPSATAGSRSSRPRCWSPTAASRRSTPAFAAMLDPGDEVIVPAPYWTTYPEAIQLAGGVPVEVLADETQDYKVTRRAARGRAHRPDQGAAVRLAVQPDRFGLHRRRDPGDRPVGRGPRPVGGDRRDLRAPRLRRRRDRVDAGAVPRPRRTTASWSTASPRPMR